MINKKMTKQAALEIFESFVENESIPSNINENLDSTYLTVRRDLLSFWESAKKERGEYQKDLSFGLKLYEYFQDKTPLPVLEDVEFWVFLCCCVVPDIVYERHGLKDEYFYKKSGRIYLQRLWQFIHMTYQNSIEQTKECLSRLSTDYIMQFSERSGREGYYLEVYREIARVFSLLPIEVLNKTVNGANLCRRVLIKNTAYCEMFNLVYENETQEYVNMLFNACGVEVKEYE